MTVVDMHHLFLLKLKTLDRTDIKDPLSYDIVAILNQAQDIIIDELIENKRFDLLRVLMSSTSVAKASFDATYVHGINTDGDSTNVPVGVIKLDDPTIVPITPVEMTYRSYVRSQAGVTRTQTPAVTPEVNVQIEEISKDLIGDFEINGSNYPIFTNPKGILEGSYLIVMGDYYTDLLHIIPVVVRTPKRLHLTDNVSPNVKTCELPTYLHEVIVDKAVQIFGDTINRQDLKK